MNRKRFIFPFFMVLSLISVAALLTFRTKIPSVGKIKAIGIMVYQDAECTAPLTLIEWGDVEPGNQINHSLYARNEGNMPVLLSLSTENWNPPSASLYLTLSWDYDNTLIIPSDIRMIILTLHVASDVSGIDTFNFDIVIMADEQP